ncbi:MAG: hypothetical protein QF704_15130, partial [Anaerolineales bacterium]|nr:hypothetical protein [Anaerolineales bacterium]
MKNVKVILIGVALCATVFANARIDALGGDAGFWSGDRANAAIFPGTLNDASWVEFGGVEGTPSASINWGEGTKWGMNFDAAGNNDWVNMSWAKDGMGLSVGFTSADDAAGTAPSGFDVAWGSSMSFGELGVGYSSADDGTGGDAVTNLWANWRGDLGFWVFDQAKANFSMGDNDMSLGFDLFTHVTPADGVDVLVAWGFGYASTTEDHADGEGSSMWLPNALVAAEAAMTDWATVRAFVSQDHKLSCDDGGADCATGNSTDYGFGVGFGWQASNGSSINLDMEVSNSLFTDPIGSMSGYSGDFSD